MEQVLEEKASSVLWSCQDIGQLASQKQKIIDDITEKEGEVSDDVAAVFEVVSSLLENKIDKVGMAMKGFEALEEYLSARLSQVQTVRARIEELLDLAVRNTPDKKITGLAWEAKVKNNGGKIPVVIVNEDLIPIEYKRAQHTLKIETTADDEKTRFYLMSCVVKKILKTQEDYDALSQDEKNLIALRLTTKVDVLKDNIRPLLEAEREEPATDEPKDPVVPGAILGERGSRVELKPIAKTSTKKGKK